MIKTESIFEHWEAFSRVAHPLLKPIEAEAEYLEALTVLDQVIDRMKAPDDPRYSGLFRLLAERVAAWEKERESLMYIKDEPIPAASPTEMLAFFMEQHGITQYELTKALPTRVNWRNGSTLNPECSFRTDPASVVQH
jgi:HTH-type transcriptional regulator/antitoxin HigA